MAKVQKAVWAEEKAEVEVLLAQKDEHVSIGRRLKTLQASVEGGGRTVRDGMGQVHSNTNQHQIEIHNIEKLIKHIDKMLEPGQDKGKEEKIIRAGPAQVGLSEYLNSLKRVNRALEEMGTTNLRANQQAIGDFNELLAQGGKKLEEVYRSLLLENAQPLEPLHYLTRELSFPALPNGTTSELGAMDKYISSASARKRMPNHRESPSVQIYSDIRGAYLVDSLQNLSLASISTSKKKNSDELYRQGSNAINQYIKAIDGIFLAEFQNISTSFPRDDWTVAFETTCRRALTDFAKTLRELNAHIKSNLTTDCFLAYEIIEVVTDVAHHLSSKTGESLPFGEALKPVREIAKFSIPELLEDQRRRIMSLVILPVDGSAIPFTSEMMARLQSLTAYPKSLSSILASIGDGNWTPSALASRSNNSSTSLPSLKSLDVGADGAQLLTHYVLDTLEAHLTTLESRARILYKSKAVHGVFISNTVALIDRMIRSSDLASFIGANPGAQSKIDTWRRKGVSTYMDAWREPSSALLDSTRTSASGARPHSGASLSSAEVVKSLGGKEKDAIKEKFKLFNASFDECVKRHKELSPGMEREVKSELTREVGHQVEPLYARFYDRYEALDKGKGKYVKYDKGSLAAALASL